MTIDISRRNFIKLGTIAGISVLIGRLPRMRWKCIRAPVRRTGCRRTARFAIAGDALRKVTGRKTFALDFRARDLPGWPKEQRTLSLSRPRRPIGLSKAWT